MLYLFSGHGSHHFYLVLLHDFVHISASFGRFRSWNFLPLLNLIHHFGLDFGLAGEVDLFALLHCDPVDVLDSLSEFLLGQVVIFVKHYQVLEVSFGFVVELDQLRGSSIGLQLDEFCTLLVGEASAVESLLILAIDIERLGAELLRFEVVGSALEVESSEGSVDIEDDEYLADLSGVGDGSCGFVLFELGDGGFESSDALFELLCMKDVILSLKRSLPLSLSLV